MFWMTVFMMDSTHMEEVQELGVPLCVSTSMQTEPPAVTCPVYLGQLVTTFFSFAGETIHLHQHLNRIELQ